MFKKPSHIPVLLLVISLILSLSAIIFSAIIYRRSLISNKTLEKSTGNISKLKSNFSTVDDFYAELLSDEMESLEASHTLLEEARRIRIPTPAPQLEVSPASEGNGHTVAIDPGHQGWHINMSDLEPLGPGSSEMKAKASTGTAGTYSGLAEFELNLSVSQLLRDILQERGYRVVLTREDNDTAISNAERAQMATANGADIYVRIHANGDDSHTISGALTMVPSSSNPFVAYLAEDSYRLGQCILDSYCNATGFSSHGVQYYDNMTGINWSTVPVTIIEMGFMTYQSDDMQMADPEFQKIMAAGIADGIDAYFSN